MGYDLHITRRAYWLEEGNDIALEEFVERVRRDAEFKYPGQLGDVSADWCSSKTCSESWLHWENGQIYTKNPDPEFINKMVSLAGSLGAKVRGDDGEIYRSATDVLHEPPPASPPPVEAQYEVPQFLRWPLWKQMIAAFLLGCILLALKLWMLG